jgi:hypothetical protein
MPLNDYSNFINAVKRQRNLGLRHDITELLLKVSVKTINPNPQSQSRESV